MSKHIRRREFNPDHASALHALHPILQRVYSARKVTSPLELDKEFENLHSYESLLGIEKAVEILTEALTQNQKILVVGDFDADGATSVAVALRALKSFGATQLHFLVPNRFAYGYGLTPELVNEAKDFAPDLIITVDNGIANHAGVLAAKALGIKVVITDHHLPASTLPDAHVIINPNQPNDPFPSKNLAGVGVIFYVMLALRRNLVKIGWFEKQSLPQPNMAHLLDLVALGTVADLVPLDHNNRILVHQGLRIIRSGRSVLGIMALLELADRDFRRVVASDLGFAVASRLNAAGRMDDMSLGIECLLSNDSFHVREIARTLNQLNTERKVVEQDMQGQALVALKHLHSKLKGELPRGICLFDETWHQGVVGILASRIKERFHRPVVVFAPGQENELKGSARSIDGLHIRDVLAIIDVKYPGLMIKFGGHAMAAGLSIVPESFHHFEKVFAEVVSEQTTEAGLQHWLMTDGELLAEDFNIEVASLLREAGPWGQAFPEPLFDDVFRLLEQRIVGDKHLKLRLEKNNKVIDAIAFFVDTNEWPNHRCQAIRAVYRLDVNEYKGRTDIQMILEYIEPLA